MITKVIIYNAETRKDRDNFGETESIEITGNQFGYILRNIESFPELFGYLNSIGEWSSIVAKEK